MIIKEIDAGTFSEFANNHLLKNFYQTQEYGEFMRQSEFSVMYIGAYIDNVIIAGSLILYKSIGPSIKYGYSPRGFLIDYYDDELLTTFTKKIKDFFFKKGFAFIKINPEVTYARLDFDNKSKIINSKNRDLIDKLKNLGYDKLKDNLYYESLLPKYTPVIYLPNYNLQDLDKSLIDSMNDAEISGLTIVNGNIDNIDLFYKFVDDDTYKTKQYFKSMYEFFSKNNMIDLLLVELHFDTYVKYLQKQHIYESEKNDRINIEFNENPNNNDLYRRKMKSDQRLSNISSEIVNINTKMTDNNTKDILGSALVIKHKGRITIYICGISEEYNSLDIKTFIYYKIIEEYKKAGYLFFDLNGITADYTESNPYKEDNEFKLKFKPNVFEYIGEFDLITNKAFHQILLSTNKIQKEFYRPSFKKAND